MPRTNQSKSAKRQCVCSDKGIAILPRRVVEGLYIVEQSQRHRANLDEKPYLEKSKGERMKKLKKQLALFLVLCTLVVSISTFAAFAIEQNGSEIGGNEELKPHMANGCGSYTHYEVVSSWRNGNPREMNITQYYRGEFFASWTMLYDEKGDNSLPDFHGCQCPLCK